MNTKIVAFLFSILCCGASFALASVEIDYRQQCEPASGTFSTNEQRKECLSQFIALLNLNPPTQVVIKNVGLGKVKPLVLFSAGGLRFLTDGEGDLISIGWKFIGFTESARSTIRFDEVHLNNPSDAKDFIKLLVENLQTPGHFLTVSRVNNYNYTAIKFNFKKTIDSGVTRRGEPQSEDVDLGILDFVLSDSSTDPTYFSFLGSDLIY